MASGHLLYATASGTLQAAAFDADRLEVSGPPVVVVEDVFVGTTGAADFAVSDDGLLVYSPGLGDARSVVWVDRQGREEPVGVTPDGYSVVRIAPDGGRLALVTAGDIYVWNVAREQRTRLTFDPARDRYPVWTPDSSRILFSSEREGVANLFWKRANNAGSVERLTETQETQLSTSISRNGAVVIVHDTGIGGQSNIHAVSLQDEPVFDTSSSTPYEDRNGELSPDGRWLAYQSNQSGQTEVWVRAFPDASGGRSQISTSGGTKPAWAPNGRELFFVSDEFMAVPVELGEVFSYGTPEPLFPRRHYFGGPFRNYDVWDTGQRFLGSSYKCMQAEEG